MRSVAAEDTSSSSVRSCDKLKHTCIWYNSHSFLTCNLPCTFSLPLFWKWSTKEESEGLQLADYFKTDIYVVSYRRRPRI